MSSSCGSRLSKVANQRRRQRKERLAANKDKVVSDNAGDTQGANTHGIKEKGDKYEQPALACAPTASCTFDDSTISSAGTWFTGGQSTMTDGQSAFTDVQSILTEDSCTFAPPMNILSPTAEQSKKSEATNLKAKPANTAEGSKPTLVITTPRRKNLSAYHAARRRLGGAASVSSTSAATTTSTLLSTVSIASSTPNNKCPTPRHNNTTPKHHNQSTPKHNDFCATPRNSNLSTPRNDHDVPPPSPSAAASTPEQVMLLRLERDKLRADVATFRRKLQNANETKNETSKEKDDAIADLESKLHSLSKEKDDVIANLEERLKSKSKELELSKSQTRCAKLQTQETEQKMHDETKLKDTAYQKKLHAVEKKLGETSEELSRLNHLLKEMTNERYSVDQENKSLKQEVIEMKKKKDEAEDNWNECLVRLDRMELEYEEKIEQHTNREAQLKHSLENLQSEKRSTTAESKRSLTSVENQLATALEEKRDLEKSFQDQLSDLQNELQMQRNSSDNVKRHHAKIVEGLKSDLHKARQLREESASSMQRDMEEMKEEYDESMSYYKGEVESLRAQLRSTKSRADADRKEWMSTIQPQYERELELVKNEKKELEVDLAQAKNDIECLKNVRDKDIELLESELNKTYKAKVELDAEVKDTKRQLHNALRNLDEMTFDGGKMRSDLEGVMNDFTKEKRQYHKEIDHLKSCNEDQKRKLEEMSRRVSNYEEVLKENSQLQEENINLKSCTEEQKCKIDAFSRDNERFKESRNELQNTVSMLEDRLMNEVRNNQQHDVEADSDREILMLENQYLKNRLEKAEEDAANFSADAVAAAAAAAEAAEHNHSDLSEHKATITQLQSENLQLSTQIAHHIESMEQLRSAQRDASGQLSRANQTIQILKSKERYLESRVESLASQISKTVRDYEMRLTSSASGESNGGTCSKSSDLKQTKNGIRRR